jgi:hypothetical protein
VTIIDQAQENRKYVRRLLKKKQPEFAALLESLELKLPCPVCGEMVAGHRRRRYPMVQIPVEQSGISQRRGRGVAPSSRRAVNSTTS